MGKLSIADLIIVRRWLVCVLAIFGSVASLAPVPAQAQGTSGTVLNRISALEAEVATLQSQVSSLQTGNSSLQSQVNSLQTQLATVLSNKALKLGPFVDVDPSPENGVAGPNIKLRVQIFISSAARVRPTTTSATGERLLGLAI